MTPEVWTAVDNYINRLLVPSDAVLDATLESITAAGLPAIQVSPSQGKLLYLLARMLRARHILEIGTLAGYSTIWLARALEPQGRVVTLEFDPRHAQVACTNFARAGLTDLIELRVGPALETLPKLVAESGTPFDLVFIDANKSSMAEYFEWSVKLSHPGSVIVADNVIRNGRVIDADSSDPDIQGVRRFNERVASEPRAAATTLQTVGSKGYDGFALIVLEE